MHATTTLSQAFEAANNIKFNDNNSHNFSEAGPLNSFNLEKSLNENTLQINNANSCDLNILIEKENILLKKGLDNIDLIKEWYQIQLNENKNKQANIQKLKHQNLFGIDKMLTDLKQLNDLNEIFNSFLSQHENYNRRNQKKYLQPDINSAKNKIAQKENIPIEIMPLPAYDDYIEQFDLSKRDNELEKYLKEKQEKIDFLQREKSQLIRKLFEMKSESVEINKNFQKIQNSSENYEIAKVHVKNLDLNTKSKVIPIQIETKTNDNQTNKQVQNKSKNDNKIKKSAILNFVELPAKSLGKTILN